jgi:hypothetical protein
MLRFEAYRDGKPAKDIDLAGAYVFGQESIPVRADLVAADGLISCTKRVAGACGLAMMWPTGTAGRFLMSTTRLPERGKPYNLNVELARGQMSRIAQKREEWGLFDYPDAAALGRDFDRVQRKFIDSMKATDPRQASLLADEALQEGLTLGERVALFHADVFLERRRLAPPAARGSFGCAVDLLSQTEQYQERMRDGFDFLGIPIPWKHIEPKEHAHQFAQVDAWMNWAARTKKAVHAGPLVSFEPANLPEWLYIWEHDYEALRDLIYEHIQRIVQRYEKQVRLWRVVSGINAYNNFDFSFEQLMELTRMSCLLVKKMVPKAVVVIELVHPWGEYYARNQRTIPPLLYADMAVQSGIKFDAFGLQVCMGVPSDGLYVRDLLQVSSLLDEFVALGKPIHVTACQVPSEISADGWDAWGGQADVTQAGLWHNPWNQRLQAEWLQAFFRTSLSKPFVESICWRDLADYEGHYIPHGGLCRSNMEPKLAYKELRNFRASLNPPTAPPGPLDRKPPDGPPTEQTS